MLKPSELVEAVNKVNHDTSDALVNMLRAVERIHDGLDGVRELCVQLAPGATPPATAGLTSDERMMLMNARQLCENAEQDPRRQVVIGAQFLSNVLAIIERHAVKR